MIVYVLYAGYKDPDDWWQFAFLSAHMTREGAHRAARATFGDSQKQHQWDGGAATPCKACGELYPEQEVRKLNDVGPDAFRSGYAKLHQGCPGRPVILDGDVPLEENQDIDFVVTATEVLE